MGKRIGAMALAALMASSLHAAAPIWKKSVAIPVATEGLVCNSVTDKIAVTSTNQVLSCQSGLWKKATGGGAVTFVTGGYGNPSVATCPGGKSITGGQCSWEISDTRQEIWNHLRSYPSGNSWICSATRDIAWWTAYGEAMAFCQ